MVPTLKRCTLNLASRCRDANTRLRTRVYLHSVLYVVIVYGFISFTTSVLLAPLPCFAQSEDLVDRSGTIDWKRFSNYMKAEKRNDEITGWSYIISGSLATVGGAIGYNSTQDPFAKAVYAIAQSIGIGAVGYGGSQIIVGSTHKPFFEAINHTPSLSEKQRTEVLNNYLDYKRQERDKSAVIRAITHGLVAALNGINASREQNADLKNALYFVGGINLLAALSYTF